MKETVLITKAGKDTYWYADYIPLVKTVVKENHTHYVCMSLLDEIEQLVLKTDCS